LTAHRYTITVTVTDDRDDPDDRAVEAIALLRQAGFEVDGPP